MRTWHWNIYGVQLMVVAQVGLGLGFNIVTCPHCGSLTLALILGPCSAVLTTIDHDLRHLVEGG